MKRNKKKWLVYCLKSKQKEDWIYVYKIGCCKIWNIQNRIYYWNSKLKIKFDLLTYKTSKDTYKEENKLLWILRDKNLCLYKISGELFGDFYENIEDTIRPYFLRDDIWKKYDI